MFSALVLLVAPVFSTVSFVTLFSYLPEKTDEYILDYTNTKVSQNSYRQKYVMNKFNYFIVEDMKIDKDSKKSSDKAIENKVKHETLD